MSFENALYADLSRYYDQFCADIDYRQHIEFSRRVHQCFGDSKGKDYLDLACGTGQLLEPMRQAGYTVSGLDFSADMLAAAQLRCPHATLLHADMADIQAGEGYDFITCFLYSLHYSYPMTAIEKTLIGVFNALKPGGVFVFDTVDKAGIQGKQVVSSVQPDDCTQLSFRSGWIYDGCSDALSLHIEIKRQSDEGEVSWHDKHTMTACNIVTLIELMQRIGFEVTPLEHDFSTLRAWQNESFNAIVVGKKP